MRDDDFDRLTVGTLARTAHPRLLVLGPSPLNAETHLALHRGVITPNEAFYVRSHFPAPSIDRYTWRLRVEGDVEQPLSLTFDELLEFPTRSLLVTLECAGNGRRAMRPQPAGEPWNYGAVSSAEWTGVPLHTILAVAGLTPSVSNIVVEGADSGYIPEAARILTYERSLPRSQALHPDTLLAYAMNGEELSTDHGFPIRLIVPGWYGMAAVKWVTRIRAQSHPFDGFYQVERYVMAPPDSESSSDTPLTLMYVRSLISEPETGATLPWGDYVIRGFAWSGTGPIARVDVSVDGGATWEAAQLTSRPESYLWTRWEYCWRVRKPGPAVLLSRACDAAGNQQPATMEWNRLGYANNAIQTVQVFVT